MLLVLGLPDFMRRVNTQINGKTPIKERVFDLHEPTNCVNPVSPSPERPKTSRKTQNPSPEKFTDYVIPTETTAVNQREKTALYAIFLIGLTV